MSDAIEIPTGTWTIDPKHSAVTFLIKHMGFARIHGRFRDFSGEIEVDAERGTLTARGQVAAASIDTSQAKRDEHLRSADFFDAERFPAIAFETSAALPDGSRALRLTGPLTMHGVTRELTLDGEVAGLALGHDGQQRLGIALAGALDRSEFGIDYSRIVEGLVMLPNHIRIALDLQATPKG